MTPQSLWRSFDAAQHDPKHYYRGLEIKREITTDEDENPFFDGDNKQTHEQFETRQTGLIIRSKRELI